MKFLKKKTPPTRFATMKKKILDWVYNTLTFLGLGVVVLAVIMVLSYPFWWVSDEDVVETASSYGMTSVQPDGYAFFQCAKSEAIGVSFTATNPNGKPVHGVVCCGLLTCGIRF